MVYYIIIIVILILLVEMFLELILLRERLNNYFLIVKRGIIFKNTIFMGPSKQGKKDIKNLRGIKRAKLFDTAIRDVIDKLPRGVKIKTRTHNSIVGIIKEAEKKGLIKDLKIKQIRKKIVLLEKLSIKNYNDLLKKKRFFKVSFIVI